jgi:hypothetical protein
MLVASQPPPSLTRLPWFVRSVLVLSLLLLDTTAVSSAKPLPAAEGSDPAATQWLEKSDRIAERAPFRVAYTVDAQLEQPGGAIETHLDATLLYGSAGTQRSQLEVALTAAALGGTLNTQGVVVADGENLWIEMDSPATGKQVLRAPLDRIEDLALSSGLPGIGTGLDPFQQIATFASLMRFEVAASNRPGEVLLVGTPTDAFEDELGASAAMFSGGMRLLLRAADGAPLRMSLGEQESPALEISFRDYEFLAAGSLPADAFTYIPPEGVRVQEL